MRYVLEAGLTHHGREFLSSWEAFDRGWKIAICTLVSGNLASDLREYIQEIKVIEPSDQFILRSGEFQDDQFSSWFQHSQGFPQAFVLVLEIPYSESICHPVEAAIGVAQVLTVSCFNRNPGPKALLCNLFLHYIKHAFGQVHSGDMGFRKSLGYRNCEVSSPACQVKD